MSATASSQVVLLERTRSGRIAAFDLVDTILSAAVAEKDAILELTTPSGLKLLAVEDSKLPENKGLRAGIYRFDLPGNALERGGAYRLRVQTTNGETLTAETSVPGGIAAPTVAQQVFNRSVDTAVIAWPASPGARSYFVRIETPFGPRSFFTDSTHVRLTGELRNADVHELPRVFIPGFPQSVTISAVDSNYYDWFRSHNERISGAGLINRVLGGFGVFGSLVRLRFQEFRVVAPQSEPAAGVFEFEGTNFERSVTPNLSLELYVESKAARSDQADAISGRYNRRPFLGLMGCLTCGVLGTVRNSRVELAMLRAWSVQDTADIFDGVIRGDTIVGTYRLHGGTARFVRQP